MLAHLFLSLSNSTANTPTSLYSSLLNSSSLLSPAICTATATTNLPIQSQPQPQPQPQPHLQHFPLSPTLSPHHHFLHTLFSSSSSCAPSPSASPLPLTLSPFSQPHNQTLHVHQNNYNNTNNSDNNASSDQPIIDQHHNEHQHTPVLISTATTTTTTPSPSLSSTSTTTSPSLSTNPSPHNNNNNNNSLVLQNPPHPVPTPPHPKQASDHPALHTFLDIDAMLPLDPSSTDFFPTLDNNKPLPHPLSINDAMSFVTNGTNGNAHVTTTPNTTNPFAGSGGGHEDRMNVQVEGDENANTANGNGGMVGKKNVPNVVTATSPAPPVTCDATRSRGFATHDGVERKDNTATTTTTSTTTGVAPVQQLGTAIVPPLESGDIKEQQGTKVVINNNKGNEGQRVLNTGTTTSTTTTTTTIADNNNHSPVTVTDSGRRCVSSTTNNNSNKPCNNNNNNSNNNNNNNCNNKMINGNGAHDGNDWISSLVAPVVGGDINKNSNNNSLGNNGIGTGPSPLIVKQPTHMLHQQPIYYSHVHHHHHQPFYNNTSRGVSTDQVARLSHQHHNHPNNYPHNTHTPYTTTHNNNNMVHAAMPVSLPMAIPNQDPMQLMTPLMTGTPPTVQQAGAMSSSTAPSRSTSTSPLHHHHHQLQNGHQQHVHHQHHQHAHQSHGSSPAAVTAAADLLYVAGDPLGLNVGDNIRSINLPVSSHPPPSSTQLSSSPSASPPSTSPPSHQQPGGPTPPIRRPARKPKTYSRPVASRFCHICSRMPRRGQGSAVCSRIVNGLCRKIVCEQCIREQGWDYAAIKQNSATWTCPHCDGGMCPPRSQCHIYNRINARRKRVGQVREEAAARAAAKAAGGAALGGGGSEAIGVMVGQKISGISTGGTGEVNNNNGSMGLNIQGQAQVQMDMQQQRQVHMHEHEMQGHMVGHDELMTAQQQVVWMEVNQGQQQQQQKAQGNFMMSGLDQQGLGTDIVQGGGAQFGMNYVNSAGGVGHGMHAQTEIKQQDGQAQMQQVKQQQQSQQQQEDVQF